MKNELGITVENSSAPENPVLQFLRARAVLGAGYRIGVKELYAAYVNWCRGSEYGAKPPATLHMFGKDMKFFVPTCKPRRGSNNVRFYENIKLLAAGGCQPAAPRKAPLECLKCHLATGPLHEVDADHAGWLCPTCYAEETNSPPTAYGGKII